MKYTLVLHCAGDDIESARTALDFAGALLTKGHEIFRIFFYGPACALANRYCEYPESQFNPYASWAAFLSQNDLEACVCIAAANRRGLFSQQQSEQLSPPTSATIAAPFVLTGLGQLIEACALCDRVITFR